MKVLSKLIHFPCLIFLIALFVIPARMFSQQGEYVIKGIFLEKFTRFIDWPQSSGIDDTSKPFVIGVIGRDPFNSLLNQLYQNQKIKNKRVEIQYLSSIYQINDCNLLFISSSEKNRISEIIKMTRNKPILTISDSDILSRTGVIINLRLRNKKIYFEIDERAAREANLYMSHLLLKEAIIVDSIRGQE
jgi:hypothetical protein